MSLYRRGGVWWLDVYVGKGRRRIRRSTGTTEEVRARIIEQSVVAVNRNIISRQRAARIIDDLFPRRERSLPLAEASEFYEACARGDGLEMTGRSLRHRLNMLSKFVTWARGNSCATSVEEVDAQLAFEFVKTLGRGLTAKTKNTYIGDLCAAWKLFMRHGKANANPWPIVRMPRNRREEASGRAFSRDEIHRLLAAADTVGRDWPTTIMIGLYTGLRLGDATTLRWSDVDLDGGVICLRPAKTRKHDITVRIPIHPVLARWLEDHRNESEHVTPARVGRIGRSRFYDGDRTFAQLLSDAGIMNRDIHEKLSFHCFRHTFVSCLAKAGVAPDVRMRLAGHTSAENHAIYTHDDVSTTTAINSLPDISYTPQSQQSDRDTKPTKVDRPE